MKCNQCGGTEFDDDRARADLICLNCGVVVSENAISNEVEFTENNAGGYTAVARFISDQTRKRIEMVCGQLRLGEDVITSAFRYYQSALFRGLTRGRGCLHIAASCVYLAARQLRVNLMLLDLSDVLELGDKTASVATTAMRLLQRMKKDWIAVGRRPNGVAAAALVVACRIHEFNRTEQDVAKVARIGDKTTRKRMNEFGLTASSSLSIEAFLNVDYEEEEDPPAFREAVENGSKRAREISELEMRNISSEISSLSVRIDKELILLSNKRVEKSYLAKAGQCDTFKSKGLQHLMHPSASCPNLEGAEFDINSAGTSPGILQMSSPKSATQSSVLTGIGKPGGGKDGLDKKFSQYMSREVMRNVLDGVVDPCLLDDCVDDLQLVTTCSGDHLNELMQNLEEFRNCKDELAEHTLRGLDMKNAELIRTKKLYDETKTKLDESFSACNELKDIKPFDFAIEEKPALKLPIMLPLGSKDNPNELPPIPTEENTKLKTDDIDDEELANEYMLNPQEVLVKATLWFKENASFLKDRRKRAAQKRALKSGMMGAPVKKLRGDSKGKGNRGQNSNQKSLKNEIVEERTLSKKINYDALQDMQTENTLTKSQPTEEDNCQPDMDAGAGPGPGPLLTASLLPAAPQSGVPSIAGDETPRHSIVVEDDDQESSATYDEMVPNYAQDDEDWMHGEECW